MQTQILTPARRAAATGPASEPLFEPAIVRRALVDSFRKLDPRCRPATR